VALRFALAAASHLRRDLDRRRDCSATASDPQNVRGTYA
jgi:hypothetical protein